MTGARCLGLSSLLVVGCGGDDGARPAPNMVSPQPAMTGTASIESTLDAYLKERAVENAFICECDVSGSGLDDCLNDAAASPLLRQCLSQAASLAPSEVAATLACVTQVTRDYNDCASRAKSCDGEEAFACERALEAQQFRCNELPMAVQKPWYDCKDRFDPNFAGDDD